MRRLACVSAILLVGIAWGQGLEESPFEAGSPFVGFPEQSDQQENPWEVVLNPEWFPEYFDFKPEDFLIDPQRLLSGDEATELRDVLEFHSHDSKVGLHVYLFDQEQELPEGEGVFRVVDRHFDDELAVVLFYFLGKPERSGMAFTRTIREQVSENAIQAVGRACVRDAAAISDPVSQIESFLLKLSARTSAIERIMETGGEEEKGWEVEAFLSPEETTVWGQLSKDPVMLYSVIVAGGLIPVFLIGLFGRYYTERKREFVFPDAQGSPLMGAPHAAGVGGVISYSSVSSPPSSQREERLNYLQRL